MDTFNLPRRLDDRSKQFLGRLRREVERTDGRAVLKVLDCRAHPDLSEKLDAGDAFPVVISISKGRETRRGVGFLLDKHLKEWVKDEAWLVNV